MSLNNEEKRLNNETKKINEEVTQTETNDQNPFKNKLESKRNYFKDENGQYFSNFFGLNYPSPKTPKELPKERSDNNIKYISGGSPYNKYYNKIQTKEFDKKLEILQTPLPNPKDFQEYHAYEEALLKWEDMMNQALKDIEMADVGSSLYFRPRVTQTLDEIQIEADFQTENIDLELKMMEESEFDTNEDELSLSESSKSSNHILKKDPWDSLLVPKEPNPDDYDTFEDFEEAMLNWTHLCSIQVPIIPPSSEHLQGLLPIKVAITKNVNKGEDIDYSQEESTIGIKSGLYYPESAYERIIKVPEIVCDFGNIETFVAQKLNGWNSLNENSKRSLRLLMEKLLDTLTSRSIVLRPSIFGSIRGRYSQKEVSETRIALRRKDIKAEVLNAFNIGPPTYDGKTMTFAITDQDINTFRFGNQVKLIKKQRLEYENIEFENKYLDTRSDYEFVPEQTIEKQKESLKNLIFEKVEPEFYLNHISRCLSTDILYDKFVDLINTKVTQGKPQSFLDLIFGLINKTNFLELVYYLNITNSLLYQKKLSYVLCECIRSQILFEDLFINEDKVKLAEFFHTLAYAFQLTNNSPVDVFPYRHDTIENLRFLCKGDLFTGLMDILISYYITYIIDLLTEYGKKKPAMPIFVNFLTEKRQIKYNSIEEFIKKKSTFGTELVNLIAHRSLPISGFSLFEFSFLISCKEAKIVDLLITEEAKIVQAVREIALKKFRHSQYAAIQLYSYFSQKENKKWNTLIINMYQNTELLMNDLQNKLLSEMVFNLLKPHLKSDPNVLSKGESSYLLEEKFYNSLTQCVTITENPCSFIVLNCSKLALYLVRAYDGLDQIQFTPKPTGESKLTSTKKELNISQNDIRSMLNWIATESNDSVVMEAKYVMMKILKVMLKKEQILEAAKVDSNFISKMVECCRSNDRKLCKISWDVFYSMIKHNTTIIEFFKKEKILDKFLNLINSSSDYPIMANGLRCLTKIFEIPARSMEKMRKMKIKPNDSKLLAKSLNNDLKAFIDHLFNIKFVVRVHMIYKKLISTYSGAFHELAHFYKTLNSEPICEELLKEVKMKKEYKEGLVRLLDIWLINQKK